MRLNWANRITIVRILLIIPFVICMLNHNNNELSSNVQNILRYAAAFLFMLMAASDGVDGYLARKKGQCTALGAFLDPTADKLLMASAALLLTHPSTAVGGFRLPTTVAVLIIGKDLFLLIGFLIVHFITTNVRVVPAKVGKVATALQLSMVAGVLLGPEISVLITPWIWVMRVLWWSAAVTAIIATFIYIRKGSCYIEQFEQSG